MLFNSYIFIFVFLPIIFMVYTFLVKKQLYTLARLSLAISSIIFCAYSDAKSFLILITSVFLNYILGKILIKHKHKSVLILGICLNLLTLGAFKYINFFLININKLFHIKASLFLLTLPIGLSFYTFQQISFLVDTYHKKNNTDKLTFINYFIYVCFFPKLIQGPIVRYNELVPQLEDEKNLQVNWDNITLGIIIFFIGLFKKTVIADNLTSWVSLGFNAPEPLSFIEAWAAALSYSFQIYFDFSSYSEMAIGVALLFNIVLPINFNSPYKSNSVIDFWKRWHISLSRFLQDYLYIPLGGNRRGPLRKYINLFITMLLGGLWHGAGWTFIMWGCLHGIYLIINHSYRNVKNKIIKNVKHQNEELRSFTTILKYLPSRILTFVAVVFAWVFFRSHNFTEACKILSGMLGMSGFKIHDLKYLVNEKTEIFKLALLWIWVNCAPNTLDFAKKFKPKLIWVLIIAIMITWSTSHVNRITQFIYNQF